MSKKSNQENTSADKLKDFISYSRQDLAFVDHLQVALSDRGVDVFVDRKDIEKSEAWWARIKQLILESDNIIFILSAASIDSDICQKEVDFATSLNKRFVPIVVGDLTGHTVPDALAQLNYIYFIADQRVGTMGDFDDVVDQLVRALRMDIGWIREHTRLGVLAQRWQAHSCSSALVLRGTELELAEAWIAGRPAMAPVPTQLQQDFIVQSRRAATRRQRTVVGLSFLTVIMSLSLAGLAYWQREIATGRLATQRVVNGTTAALDGDLASAWDWYTDALSIASRSFLSEKPHRTRLAALRNNSPLVAGFWKEDGEVAAVRFSPDGSTFAVLVERGKGDDARLRIYNRDDLSLKVEHQLGDALISHLLYAPNGDILTAGTFAVKKNKRYENTYLRLSQENQKILQKISFKDSRYIHLENDLLIKPRLKLKKSEYIQAFAPGGDIVATYSWGDGKLRIRPNDPDKTEMIEVPFIEGKVTRKPSHPHTVVFNPPGDKLIVFAYPKNGSVWRIAEGKVTKIGSFEYQPWPEQVIFDPMGRMLVTQEQSNDRLKSSLLQLDPVRFVREFDHELAKNRWEYPRDPSNKGSAGAATVGGSMVRSRMLLKRKASLGAHGDRLLTFSKRNQRYRIWKLHTGEILTPQTSHYSQRIDALAISSDGRYVLSGAADGSVKLTDVALPRHRYSLIGSERVIKHLEFHPTRPEQLLISFDGGAQLFDWQKNKLLSTFNGKTKFGPGGTVIMVTTSRSIQFLDAEDPWRLISRIPFPDDRETELSENSRYILMWSRHYSNPNSYLLADTTTGKMIASGTLEGKGSGKAVVSERLGAAYLSFYNDKIKKNEVLSIKFARTEGPLIEKHALADRIRYFFGEKDGCIIAIAKQRTGCIKDILAQKKSERSAPYLVKQATQLSEVIARHPLRYIVVMSDKKRRLAQAYHMRSGKPISPVFSHDWRIQNALIGRDGNYLITYSGNKAHLWDINSAQAIIPEMTLPDAVTAAAYNPTTGVFVASAKSNLAGKRHAVFVAHTAPLRQTVEEIGLFASLNGGHEIDQAGGRVPLVSDQLIKKATTLTRQRLASFLPEQNEVGWYWQLVREAEGWTAINHLERIVELAPKEYDARAKLATRYKWAGQTKKAITQHEILFAENRFETATDYVDLLKKANRYKDAIAFLERAIKKNPIAGATYMSAELKWRLNDLAGALADYQSIEKTGKLSQKMNYRLSILGGALKREAFVEDLCQRAAESVKKYISDNQNRTARWNATYYAAAGCIHSPRSASVLRDMVGIMHANVPTGGRENPTLKTYQAAVALNAGNPTKAIELTAGLNDLPLAVAIRFAAQKAANVEITDQDRIKEIQTWLREFDSHESDNHEVKTEIDSWFRLYGVNP